MEEVVENIIINHTYKHTEGNIFINVRKEMEIDKLTIAKLRTNTSLSIIYNTFKNNFKHYCMINTVIIYNYIHFLFIIM